MSQPTRYARQYNFTGFSASYPSDQQPGVQLDAEFNAVRQTLTEICSNLAFIQRDDGALASGSVSLDQLTADVLTFLGSSTSWTLRGTWQTGTSYSAKDVVVESGSTYLCYSAHVSGTFAADLASNKWIVIYSATSVVVPNGAVTEDKIAAGAVTATKLSLTDFTITGNFKAATLSAGTETAGTYAIGGKAASGDVVSSIARETRAQGAVAFRLGGGTSGSDWQVRQAASSDNLTVYNSLGNVTTATLFTGGMVDWGYTQRVTGSGTPTTGAGMELFYASSTGYLQAYDRDAATWKSVAIRGLGVSLWANGVSLFDVSASGVSVKDSYGNFQDVGFRGLPMTASRTTYTLTLSDAGMCVPVTTGGVAIPANGTTAFPIGTVIVVYNDSSSSQAITITTDTLRLAGSASTGGRTLAAYGFATLVKVKSTEWVASGAGVS